MNDERQNLLWSFRRNDEDLLQLETLASNKEKGFAEHNRDHCWPEGPGHFARLQTLQFSDSRGTGSMYMSAELLQLYPTLCDTVDGSPPGSSVHGILQARTLAWAAMPFSRRSPDPGIESTSHKPLALQADSSQLSHWGSPALGLGCPKPQAVLPHSLESGPQYLSHSPAYGDWPHY